ncbi:hypothetical protein J2Z40_003784 [Cytobacillus eiseniae]|uniref:Uncharacterized protein n=1 Tax=Cytobacillus eiseniae TaxID=762947 RepID=A0ABS4RJX6_9BACI|nr:hypothetical protein [Cytobacillus eiseniae]MBP2243196.1 hypothetical protein [Cytobacillus eiseniae]
MRQYVIPILKGIATGILETNRNGTFIIKCSKCECSSELEYQFFKGSGDIEVNIVDENIVSIRCGNCGNEISSSEY